MVGYSEIRTVESTAVRRVALKGPLMVVKKAVWMAVWMAAMWAVETVASMAESWVESQAPK